MKPAPFGYLRPRTREEVDALLDRHGDEAKLLAGGQSLLPILNMRLAAPGWLVDLNHLDGEATSPTAGDGFVAFGPLVRQETAERSALVAGRAPLLAEALRFVAHPAVRSRGTVVGSIAHADPAAELPAVLVLLGGEVRARRAGGQTRTVPAADFFLGPLEPALEPGEWVEEVRVPAVGPRAGHAFVEFARRSGDYALCGVAATATDAGPGRARVGLCYLAMGGVPARVDLPELDDAEADGPALGEAVAAATAGLEAGDDLHASAAYRRHLAGRLGAGAARRAVQRLRGREG
jgi:aerobic carbon-monoxide dehydrogenase medium subunit